MDCKENEAKEEESKNPAIILRFKRNSTSKQFECSVCPCSYTQLSNLKYHIRREHYNLAAKITTRETRQINDVWFEKVINTNDVVEIKKTGHNKFLMKKASNSDSVRVEEPKEIEDLTPLYPVSARPRKLKIWCGLCEKTFPKENYKRHLDEDHADSMV